jgi:hypothetical protein
VAANPFAVRRWRDKMKAIVRGAVAKSDLIIMKLPITLSVISGKIVGQSKVLQYSTGAAEYFNSVHWEPHTSSEFSLSVAFRTFFV